MDDGKLPPPFSSVTCTVIERGSTQSLPPTSTSRSNARMVVAQSRTPPLRLGSQPNVVTERDTGLTGDQRFHRRKQREPTRRRKQLMERILLLEEDGADQAYDQLGVTLPSSGE